MRSDTANVASHEVASSQITRVGAVLRRFKFDELPQIWNVFAETMSFVGPRPCLSSQHELVKARTRHGVSALMPGITGVAQIAGLDMSDPASLAIADAGYIGNWSLRRDLTILFRTLVGGGRGDAARGLTIKIIPESTVVQAQHALPSELFSSVLPTPRRVVITGASGFLGRAIVTHFVAAGWRVDALVRQRTDALAPTVSQHCFDDLASADTGRLATIMQGAKCIVHLAATVPGKKDALAGNTAALAEKVIAGALAAATPRIIVMSSAYAALAEADKPSARAYGYEKLAAEHALRKSRSAAVRMIFLRPPVVYGRGMTGALALLAKAVSNGIPLPLGRANEARCYISRINLVDLVGALACAPDALWEKAAGRAYTPTDGPPVSTANFIRALAKQYGVHARLLPVPIAILKRLAKITGKSEILSGAIDPLLLNDNKALFEDFGWQPVEHFPDSLACLTNSDKVGSVNVR